MENFRNYSIVALCLLVVSCTSEVTTSVSNSETTTLPPVSAPTTATLKLEPPVQPDFALELNDEPIVIEQVEEPGPDAWELIRETQSKPFARNALLLRAASQLASASRMQEVAELLDVIDPDQLSEVERVNYDLLSVRMLQVADNHQTAVRNLNRLARIGGLTSEQRIRIAQLRVFSYSVLDQPVDAVIALAQIYPRLAGQHDEQLEAGHLLWAMLSRMNSQDLQSGLNRAKDPVTRQWFVLALALGLNSVRVDPYQYQQAILNWQRENPEHPANGVIQAGLAPDQSGFSNIALLLPLSSVYGASANALLDGILAQHAADTGPNKPRLQVIDIGDQPTAVTQYYYQAVAGGADLVIGPLGVDYVDEMAQYADFLVPTLLLGVVDKVALPDYVFQFALAPEHQGIGIADRARQDGHVTALIVKSPQSWSQRVVSAFDHRWQELGGHIIEVYDYELDQSDYSDVTKQILLIDSSANRYQAVRTIVGQPVKFIPRRRQDADFILLSADSKHGRLLKPYLDFLKAHDLPVYSTSQIYSGRVNKVRDQDLNGVQFADMEWVIGQSEQVAALKNALQGDTPTAEKFERLFAMGVDIYHVISRLGVLQLDAASRYHGVTSKIRMTEDGQLLRSPRWAVFTDGVPTLIPGIADPEQGDISMLEPDELPIPLADRPQ